MALARDFPRTEVGEAQRRRAGACFTPQYVPEAWRNEDWQTCCDRCRRPTFMVAAAEQRLPRGPIEVVRCTGCGRALWYRSMLMRQAVEVALRILRGELR